MEMEDLQAQFLTLDPLLYQKGIQVIRAINHIYRQQILRLIHLNGRITVTEIHKNLHLEQTLTSQQLAILRRAGFVTIQREGRHIYYSVNYKMLKEANRVIVELVSLK